MHQCYLHIFQAHDAGIPAGHGESLEVGFGGSDADGVSGDAARSAGSRGLRPPSDCSAAPPCGRPPRMAVRSSAEYCRTRLPASRRLKRPACVACRTRFTSGWVSTAVSG